MSIIGQCPSTNIYKTRPETGCGADGGEQGKLKRNGRYKVSVSAATVRHYTRYVSDVMC